MTLTRFILMVLISVLVTVPVVRLVPRARQSSFFDRLLWLATTVVAFLGAWIALGFALSGSLASMSSPVIADLPVLPTLLGAIIGALVVNLSLWVIDLFTYYFGSEEPELMEEDHTTPPESDTEEPEGANATKR